MTSGIINTCGSMDPGINLFVLAELNLSPALIPPSVFSACLPGKLIKWSGVKFYSKKTRQWMELPDKLQLFRNIIVARSSLINPTGLLAEIKVTKTSQQLLISVDLLYHSFISTHLFYGFRCYQEL